MMDDSLKPKKRVSFDLAPQCDIATSLSETLVVKQITSCASSSDTTSSSTNEHTSPSKCKLESLKPQRRLSVTYPVPIVTTFALDDKPVPRPITTSGSGSALPDIWRDLNSKDDRNKKRMKSRGTRSLGRVEGIALQLHMNKQYSNNYIQEQDGFASLKSNSNFVF